MARAVISMNKAPVRNNPSAAVTNTALFTALNAADGGEIAWNEKDDYITVVVQNSATSAGTVVFKCGDGPNAVEDLSISVAASSTICIGLDSARFKVTKGDDKGKVLMTGPATIAVAVFFTP